MLFKGNEDETTNKKDASFDFNIRPFGNATAANIRISSKSGLLRLCEFLPHKGAISTYGYMWCCEMYDQYKWAIKNTRAK